jgi:heme oxygenase
MHLTKRLYHIGYQKQDVLNLFHFIDWMMRLPEAAEKAFWEEMQSFEEGKIMKYVTSVERIGLKKGKMTLIQKQLSKRFGRLSPELEKRLQNSNSEMLDRFGLSILDFKDLKDAENWWETHGKEGNA